ncbi:hypothetical protein CAEBREN_29536 [Caenorhabditis brenneri]|uniref:Endonuclease/exonuclease/phosphatase domain-containing protein n=1 Tax=Caenorhabditis brenneri TaxID=135651 RepID=G0ML12_CAEBE|nr:hypothetical protein CAEBREN_29536 [Caenorhabditis brenneri]
MGKKVSGRKSSSSQFSIKVDPAFDHLSTTMTIKEFAVDARITSLLVNNEAYRIIRDGIPVNTVNLALTPIVNQHFMPTIIYNIRNTPVQLHWFVKNELQLEKMKKTGPTKKDVEALNLSFVNEEDRVFQLDGYIFKHTGPYYTPDENDVDRLVAVVVDSGINHPAHAAISSRQTLKAPDEIITDEQVKWCKENALKDDENTIRLMSYNILADAYLELDQVQEKLYFNYCPKAYQRFFYRTPLFLKQLHDFADAGVSIMFLQEVDISCHSNFIKPFIETIGYSSELAKKLGGIREGVATIFDQKRFRSTSSNIYALSELAKSEEENEDIWRILSTSKESLEKFETRPTVLQVVVLEDINSGVVLICANTHLHHNPSDEHLKAVQALICVRKVLKIYYDERKKAPEKDIRLIFGGDFNSTPDGPAYKLMAEGILSKDDDNWKRCDKKIVAADLVIEKSLISLTGVPDYTNFTADSGGKPGFVGCLDYIWGIDVASKRVCPMPDHQKVIQYKGLPSQNAPSDHLPIICDIEL